MFKKVLLVVLALAAILAIVIQLQPATFRVARTASIVAPPEKVFAWINDFHNWDAWSPWTRLDPNLKATFSGPASGAGAVYAWSGNSNVGEGRMTIESADPGRHVGIRLEFIKPFASAAQTEFLLAPQAGATRVTWSMSGDNNFLSKAMCLFTGGMDKIIGPDFEKGLAQLKRTVESRP